MHPPCFLVAQYHWLACVGYAIQRSQQYAAAANLNSRFAAVGAVAMTKKVSTPRTPTVPYYHITCSSNGVTIAYASADTDTWGEEGVKGLCTVRPRRVGLEVVTGLLCEQDEGKCQQKLWLCSSCNLCGGCSSMMVVWFPAPCEVWSDGMLGKHALPCQQDLTMQL